MKTKNRVNTVLTLAAATAFFVLTNTSSDAALVLRLEAANYDAGTGTWTDTSGLSNDATQGAASLRPALITGQTGNGSSVVRFDGSDDFLSLTSGISPTSAANGFTAFAYLRPDSSPGQRTIFSGGNGSFQYRVQDTDVQTVIRSGQANLGFGATALPEGTSAVFSSINARVNNAGVTDGLRFNGAADGNTVSSTFGAIDRIGRRNFGFAEYFFGDIAEIRIYNTQLTLSEIQDIEAELTAAYASSTPEPSTFALAAFGLLGLGIIRRRKRR